MFSQNDYLYRHNQVAAIVHQEICHSLGMLKEKTPYYEYKYKPVVQKDHLVYYDRSIITDRTIACNKPDIVVKDRNKKEAYIIDIAVPNTHNLMSTITEKRRKYTDLAEEVMNLWNMNKVTVIPIVLSASGVIPPIVLSATGVIPKDLHKSLKTLALNNNLGKLMQKAVVLNTTRIVRRFLSQQ
ncbi:hypothetical protein M8J77_016195 [Diaphorina citri]|nr:hypothetical protein M8J77_016195 [Diaphorina citri]